MVDDLTLLLRAAPMDLRAWLQEGGRRAATICVSVIILGFAVYGFTLGIRRAPLMGIYVALKMPLLIGLTLACNSLLNGILGIVLGTGIGLRQSLLAQLMSFAVAGLILGALSPVSFFMAINDPAYTSFLVTHTLLIAYTGVAASGHLFRLLLAVTPDRKRALLTLVCWLGGNAFVGAQFSWILRPFFGGPGLAVEWLREDAWSGTFYEAFWHSLSHLSPGSAVLLTILTLVLMSTFIRKLNHTHHV